MFFETLVTRHLRKQSLPPKGDFGVRPGKPRGWSDYECFSTANYWYAACFIQAAVIVPQLLSSGASRFFEENSARMR